MLRDLETFSDEDLKGFDSFLFVHYTLFPGLKTYYFSDLHTNEIKDDLSLFRQIIVTFHCAGKFMLLHKMASCFD